MLNHNTGTAQPSFLRGKIDPNWQRTIIRFTLLFAAIGLLAASLCASAWYWSFSRELDLHTRYHASMYMEFVRSSVRKYATMDEMLELMLRDH